MKLVIFFVFFIISSIDCKLSNRSYLKYKGSYNKSMNSMEHSPKFLHLDGQIVKHYYLSQRLTDYNWIGAYMFCRMNGMKLAVLRESTDEMQKFTSIFTDERVFVDMGVNFGTTNMPKCSLYDNGILMYANCYATKAEFVCEDVESSKLHLTYQSSKTQALSRQKFFSYLGDYVNNNKITKSYYISTIVKAPPDEGIKYCQSMDMILVSPQTQDEFENLQVLLLNAKFNWQNAAISGYRTSGDKWADTGDGLPYKFNWTVGEPNNAKANEHCLFLSNPDITLNDDPCVRYSYSGQFICEFNHQELQRLNDVIEASRFVEPFMKDSKTELYLSYENLKLSWIDAKLMCKSFDMDLFTPESEQDIKHVRQLLSTGGQITMIRTGVTKIGSDRWYSIISGESNQWFIDETNYSGEFALMTVDDGMLIESNSNSNSSKENFLCQKMYLNDGIKTNSAVMVNFRFLAYHVFILLIIHMYTNM